jgi:1-acyl-sn-glycerol-3-phosphate acyltransferase
MPTVRPHVHVPVTKRQGWATALLGAFGWTAIHEPPPGPKMVVVGYAHTSNWDFLPAIGWAWATGLKASFIGKRQLTDGPLGPIMRRLGVIPLDRDKSKNFVSQVAEIIRSRDEIALVVAAEGTRARADYWRSGFYYMALEAHVPLGLAYLDWSRKEIGIGQYLTPTGDLEADFAIIRAFYAGVRGRDPSKQGPVQLKQHFEAQVQV